MAFFLSGGVPMLFIVISGLLALTSAADFVRRPDPRKAPMIRSLMLALSGSTLAGVAAALATVATRVPAHEEWAQSPDLHLIVMVGIGESLSPLILGSSLMAVVGLVMAAGWRRARPAMAEGSGL